MIDFIQFCVTMVFFIFFGITLSFSIVYIAACLYAMYHLLFGKWKHIAQQQLLDRLEKR